MTGAWEYFGSFFPKNPVIDIFLTIMSVADLSIYYVISVMFHIILKLSEYNLDFLYDEMQNRIYLILGIFMLFKMIVSLLTYFVNPDQINDKEQGMGKLVTKIIIMLMMLIAFPNIICFMLILL